MDTLFGAEIAIPYNSAPKQIVRASPFLLNVVAGTRTRANPLLELTPAAGRNILLTRMILRGGIVGAAVQTNAFQGARWFADNDGSPLEGFGLESSGASNLFAFATDQEWSNAIAAAAGTPNVRDFSMISILVEVRDGTTFSVGIEDDGFLDLNLFVLVQGVEYDRYDPPGP